LRRRLEKTREPQRRIRGDTALAQDDLVQTVERNAQASSGFDLPDAERLQVLLEEEFTRRDRRPQPD
jgi:hypothetical protein